MSIAWRSAANSVIGKELWAVASLGEQAAREYDFAAARAALEESLAVSRSTSLPWCLGLSLRAMGCLALMQLRHETAIALLSEGLTLAIATGQQEEIADGLERLAYALWKHEQTTHATRVFALASATRERSGIPTPAYLRATYGHCVGSLREHHGAERFAAEWQAGQTMTPDQAVAYACSSINESAENALHPDPPLLQVVHRALDL